MKWYFWLIVVWVIFDVGFVAGLVWAARIRGAGAALRESAPLRLAGLPRQLFEPMHLSRN